MGNACTTPSDSARKALDRALQKRKEKEERNERELTRQALIYESKQKTLEVFQVNDSSSSPDGSFENGVSQSISNASSDKDLLSLREMFMSVEKPPTVICFNREIGEAAPGVPAFLARDHTGRLHEVMVPNPEAGFYQDEDRFLPFFHPNSPLCCEAVMDGADEESSDKSPSSRRLRFLEKSEDVQGHLKRMAPVKATKPSRR